MEISRQEDKGCEGMQRKWRRFGIGIGAMVMLFMLSFLLSGCTSQTILPKDESQMSSTEEKKVKEAAIEYIKKTYNKGFVVTEIQKDHVFGAYYNIRGNIEDGKNTTIYVTGNPPNDFQDTYVPQLWTDELEPRITEIAKETMDLRLMENIIYTDGTKETRFTGEIPSVFEVLKKGGNKNFSLTLSIRIYNHGGQSEADIAKFLNELKKMNFNRVTMGIFVYNDQLKTAPKNADAGKYLLYRYNISGDIQKIDITNLDQYKTVIKH
jgi:hypothetical protein